MGAIIAPQCKVFNSNSFPVCQDLGPHMSIGPLKDQIKSGPHTFQLVHNFVSPTPPVVSGPILLVKCINKSLLSSFMHFFIWGSRSRESLAMIYALLLHYLSNLLNQKLSLHSKIFTKMLQGFIIWWKIKFSQKFII